MDGQEMTLGAVVGAPLRAAIEAQASAASASVDFIRQLAFEPEEEGRTFAESGRLRMLVFHFDRPRKEGGTEPVRLEVPLLTMVPLPYLRLEELVVDFKVSVAAARDEEGAQAASGGEGGIADYLSPGSRPRLAANLSSKRDSTSTRSSRYAVETTMDFHLRAVQDDVPSGMQRLLSVLSEAIHVQPVATAADGTPPL
ncbi:hypothetical protein D187_005238 [Cystobacter fuscus DSM 2262]|uniref:DUF2589 domain-containing protein n=1 Tax=Cystobacter fuscus (strain ATCC 25194 / DSM 2262 / NBRC 100088 / M29) TaxID=1242864 RepID=S9PIH8_CYSF2|nr:DUF2589 domain-containing protein [Cystobacter fuscus]EPX64105.1 hypothetical protein D187_005238 [Cystobacter fuscus DSM 2262]